MRLITHISGCIAAALLLLGCEENPYGPTGYQPEVQKPEKEDPTTPTPSEKGGYAKGADISWLTQMEADGQKFYNAAGKETECTALMNR